MGPLLLDVGGRHNLGREVKPLPEVVEALYNSPLVYTVSYTLLIPTQGSLTARPIASPKHVHMLVFRTSGVSV